MPTMPSTSLQRFKGSEEGMTRYQKYARKYYQANKNKIWFQASRKKWRKSKHGRKKLRKTFRQWRQRTRELIDSFKKKPCKDCGHRFPTCCMDFHHVRGRKKFAIGSRIHFGKEKTIAEIKKCILLCANCHRIRTQKEIRA